MHEFSLASGIYATALSVATQHGLEEVVTIKLDVGAVSGVNIETLAYAWSFLRTGDTRTQNAELAMTVTDGLGDCPHCGFSGQVTSALRICPHCSALGLRFTAGEEFMLTEISGQPGNTDTASSP